MEPRSVVHLVHGTYAKQSKWPLLEQVARDTLPSPVVVYYPQWSGRNLIRDRLEAAETLRAHLSEKVHEHPEAEHYIVAHSHGGNVALMALREPAARARVAALICLSTPFLWARTRKATPGEVLAMVTGCLLFCLWPVSTIYWNVGGLAALVTLVPIIVLLGRIEPARSEAQAREVEAVTSTPAPGTPLMIIRSAADEAGISLTVVQALHYVLSRWDALSSGLSARFDRLFDNDKDPFFAANDTVLYGWVVLAMVGGMWLVPYYALEHWVPQEAGPGWLLVTVALVVIVVLLGVGLALMFVFFLCAACLAPFLLLSSVLLRAYGVSINPASALYLEFSVEPAPPGCWPFMQLEWDRVEGLSHSSSYSHPKALKQIEEWLRSASDLR